MKRVLTLLALPLLAGTTASGATASFAAAAPTAAATTASSTIAGQVGQIEITALATAHGRVRITVDGVPTASYQVDGTEPVTAVAHAASADSVVAVTGADTVADLAVVDAPDVATVNGSVVRNTMGQPWVAKGANLTGTTWGYPWPYIGHQPDAFAGMAKWGMDTVRIQVNQNYWNSCRANLTLQDNYRKYIDEQVQLALNAGLSPIVDLHTSGGGTGGCNETAVLRHMADARSITFWQTMVARWGHEPRVIFDLYNEPHDIPDAVWRDGGTHAGGEWVGMQDLYDTVRAAGYKGPVIVSGNGWAHDITVLSRYPLEGYGIIAGHHLYGQDFTQLAINDFRPRTFTLGLKGEIDRLLKSVKGTHPVWVTEFGSTYFGSPAFNAGALAYLEAQGLSWQVYVWGTRLPTDPADYDRYGILAANGRNARPNPSGQPIYDTLASRRAS